MKNHIAIKFAAVFLCALMLLTALGSGLGIVALAAMGLDQTRTLDEVYEKQTESQRRWAAEEIAGRFASENLGNLSAELVDETYDGGVLSGFLEGNYYYTVQDEDGTVLDSNYDGRADVEVYSIPVEAVEYASIEPEQESSSESMMLMMADAAEEAAMEEPVQNTAARAAAGKTMDSASRMTWKRGPAYTVILYLAPNSRTTDAAWQLLRFSWQHRNMLMILLGVSLLLFAVFAVYLCCAAGRDPGSDAVVPAGLNRMPLDLYFLLGGSIIVSIVAMGVYGGNYLLRQGLSIAAPFAIYGGYMCCLVFVGFWFAVAAQVKVRSHFWWRNSVCGRALALLARSLRWLAVTLRRELVRLPGWMGTLVWGTARLVRRIWKAGWIFLTWIWLNVWGAVKKVTRPVSKAINRFYSFLPLVWQWLLVTFFMITLLVLVLNRFRLSDKETLLCLGLCLTLVIYAANSFGTLLDAAKRMRGGNLDRKVDSHLMVGGFREFADELNGLADVVVVAANRELKSERMKTELITNVSHDIKTPLTSIINYVDLLKKPHTPEEEASYLEVLSRQSMRLKKLIEDLMEMSKASSGNVNVDIMEIDMAEAVNQALGEFADKLDAAALTPVFHHPEQVITVLADGRLLWRAMSNLLSNAVKYALPGTRLYVDLCCADDKAVLSFKNISREQLNISADELLERFVRGDSSRNTEGSGLGLNIAKSLLEVQHGQLELMVDGDLFKVTMVLPLAEYDD